MLESTPLLEVVLSGSLRPAYAGDWVPLPLALKRPEASGFSVKVKNVSCLDKELQLDTDLFQGDLEIRPGETYQLTVPVRVPHPKTVELGGIGIQVARDDDPQHDELVFLPEKTLSVRPAIPKEVRVRIRPVCAYDNGTKVEVRLKHRGGSRFDDLAVTLGPPEAVRAGKRVIRIPAFGPGDTESAEVVVAGDELEVSMAGTADGARTEGFWRKRIRPPVGRSRPAFRFLEPRRLSRDDLFVSRLVDNDESWLRPVDGAYSLRGGERYLIKIRPKDPGVTRVKLRSIPNLVHVRNSEEGDGEWKFQVNVAYADRFSKAERLYYDVDSRDGPMKGEIGLRLQPAWGRHLQLAAALGIALTIQGVGAMMRLLVRPDFSFEEAFSHFDLVHDYQMLFPLSIPVVWAGLRLADLVCYRLSN